MATLCALSAPASTADAPDPKAPLDEVVVRGKRVQLAEMRRELLQLEDRFYSRYNELNTNNDFDIHCVDEARTGTRFVRRSCRAVYQEEAFHEEAKAALATRQNIQEQLRVNKPNPTVTGPIPVPATVLVEARLPEFRKNMKAVTSRDPELGRLLKERSDLSERYEAVQKGLFGQSPAQVPASERSE
jgi:hypothetical protein